MAELFERYQAQAAHDFSAWAAEHAAAADGKLFVLENDPVNNEGQKLHINTIHGTPLEPAIIGAIAMDVDPRYEKISESCELAEEESKRLTAIGETLKAGENVILGTDHMELMDIALLLSKVSSHLRLRGYEFETALLYNKMVAWLGADVKGTVVPLNQLIGLAFDLGYMSVPGTDSAKTKLTLPRRIINNYNNRLVDLSIGTRLRRPGKPLLIGIAFPGTVNKPLDVEAFLAQDERPDLPEAILERTMVIGRASEGVTKITRHGMTMPASTYLGEDSVDVTFADTLYKVDSGDDLKGVMGWLAAVQTAADPEFLVVYDADKKFPVKKSTD